MSEVDKQNIRRINTPTFKAKAALGAVKEKKTIAELFGNIGHL